MIDSTGEHATVTIECAQGCGLCFPLPTYKPTVGHCAEPVNEGTYFDSLSYERFEDLMLVFEVGRLFKVVKVGEPTEVEVYRMTPSRGNYSYDGALMPQFGKEPGQVAWVCKRCLYLMVDNNHPWIQALAVYKEHPHLAAPRLSDSILRYRSPQPETRSSGRKSPWLREREDMDEAALVENGLARYCTGCGLAVRNEYLADDYLEKDLCPNCRLQSP